MQDNKQIKTRPTIAAAPPLPLLFWAYSINDLAILSKVIIKAPKAREPILVVELHFNPYIISADPSF